MKRPGRPPQSLDPACTPNPGCPATATWAMTCALCFLSRALYALCLVPRTLHPVPFALLSTRGRAACTPHPLPCTLCPSQHPGSGSASPGPAARRPAPRCSCAQRGQMLEQEPVRGEAAQHLRGQPGGASGILGTVRLTQGPARPKAPGPSRMKGVWTLPTRSGRQAHLWAVVLVLGLEGGGHPASPAVAICLGCLGPASSLLPVPSSLSNSSLAHGSFSSWPSSPRGHLPPASASAQFLAKHGGGRCCTSWQIWPDHWGTGKVGSGRGWPYAVSPGSCESAILRTITAGREPHPGWTL